MVGVKDQINELPGKGYTQSGHLGIYSVSKMMS